MIPRILFQPKDRSLSVEMERRQFPVRLCFAVTSNKSQGQTMKHVGIYLQQDFFGHGQLYVALTRVQNPSNLKLYRPNETKTKSYQTTNVVYKEVLVCHCTTCKTARDQVSNFGRFIENWFKKWKWHKWYNDNTNYWGFSWYCHPTIYVVG